MKNTATRNIRLGIVVLAGLIFFVLGLYLIGEKQNLFSSTFRVTAHFENVNGLMKGNNVRLSGVNVGTVKNVEIINDSTVQVDMAIEDEFKDVIKKNAIATIGTDGLMGNKLINITNLSEPAALIEEGDILRTLEPLETDAVFRKLASTNEEVNKIAENLREFTDKMNTPGSTWGVLTDTSVNTNIQRTLKNINTTSYYSVQITKELAGIVNDIRAGKGPIGEVLYDTTLETNLSRTVSNIQQASDSLLFLSNELLNFSNRITESDGALTTIISDTVFDRNLQESMENIKNTSEKLEETLDALKHTFIFRRYNKKKKDEQDNR